MGLLLKRTIEEEMRAGRISISPRLVGPVGPNSVDLTLHPMLRVYRDEVLDMKTENPTREVMIPDDGFVLLPGELYIGSTVEETYTPFHVPMASGRSSTGRLGVHVHVTAGFGDVGFRGQWTLEIHVVRPIRVYHSVRICQVWFFEPSAKDLTLAAHETHDLYEGRYQNQVGPTASRFHQGETK